ncbi:MAG: MBOAT family protein [Marinilabiliales bacterium]|nr:MAG: MBOAT family protein [Marinilabiliales bacterium]
MVFSSSVFLFYFLPIFLLVYFLVNTKYKNLTALLFSVFFYAWGAPTMIYLVLASLLVDFYLVKSLSKTNIGKNRKILLSVSVILNIGMLGYFKYSNFFVGNVNDIIESFGGSSMKWTEVLLPIGISFFTFQKMSYTIDVYRKSSKALDSFVDYSMYILLFPQLIAGPIVRYNEIEGQIRNREDNETWENRFSGIFRFVIGLSKKILIANTLGVTVDEIFALNPEFMGTKMAWIGVVAYSFQIYFDFSGYSDMAIGLGKILGFSFPENFNNTYISRNITEFWRRWHMTLSRWMRDYLYIPLGGNRVKSKFRLYFNLWIVFFVSGLWHGAAWNFVAWGVFHGLFLVLDRLLLIKFTDKIGKIPSIILTYFITLIGWVVFRAETLEHAILYIKKMFSFTGSLSFIYYDNKFWFYLLLGVLFSFITIIKPGLRLEKWFFYKSHSVKEIPIVMLVMIVLIVFCAGNIAIGGFNPFIYFRF